MFKENHKPEAQTKMAIAANSTVVAVLVLIVVSISTHQHVNAAPGLRFKYRSLAKVAGIRLQGNATRSRSAVWLTPNVHVAEDRTSLVGRIVYSKPLRLGALGWSAAGARFETHFTFQLVTQPASYGGAADGLAFFLSTSPDIPAGSRGEYLGVQDPSPSSSSPSFFAIEFDTYKNPYDPSASHVGVDVNTVESIVTVDTSDPSSPFFLYGGYVLRAWIEYDASAGHRISLWLDNCSTSKAACVRKPSYLSGPAPLLITSYDLSTIFGGGELLYVGLSASTGAAVEGAAVYSWAFDAHA